SFKKKKGASAFPYSAQASWAGWFRPTEISARGGGLGAGGADIPLSCGAYSKTDQKQNERITINRWSKNWNG
ncbi:MAG: hypothetical protein RIC19_20195, partial [Phaeodactylibacter sp.]|uniref:hypothetical protein n=1 Tax=Phaeodactylibacter sp. TaxID=1940289 RepID=UPI0032EF5744